MQWEPEEFWVSFPEPAWRHRQAVVWLIVAAVLALDGIRAERHQAVEVVQLDRELDHHPPGRIPAHEIAGFKDRLEKSICLAHRPHRWLPASRRNLGAGTVNES
jgi:hypothetical protein